MSRTLVVRSSRVVLPDGERAAAVHIEDGRIVAVDDDQRADVDAGDLVVSPGLVDSHVHINEPGRTEWEGFETATRAAAAGGVTTVVDMPLNCIPATTSASALDAKHAAADGRCHVDVAFWGGVVPGNARELDALVDAGVRGFKCFLAPSGVGEFAYVVEGDLREAMPVLARRRVPLLVHAEMPDDLRPAAAASGDGDPRRYATYLATRPPAAEVSAVALMVRLAREFGTHVHIVHVASAEAAETIARAKAAGIPITGETCPHYLTFDAERIPDGATAFKCAPPIREAIHRSALWRALEIGTLDLIATDHSPAPPSMKTGGDFLAAWGGIASLELSLAAVWSSGPGTTPSQLARWMAAAPARLAGLDARKGRIAPGCDGDLVIWDPSAERTVDAQTLQQRHKLTPYAGRRLRGMVKATFVRGELVAENGRPTGAPRGQRL